MRLWWALQQRSKSVITTILPAILSQRLLAVLPVHCCPPGLCGLWVNIIQQTGTKSKMGLQKVFQKVAYTEFETGWSHQALLAGKTVYSAQIYLGPCFHYGGKLHQTIIDLWKNLAPSYLCTQESLIHLLHYFSVSTANGLDIRHSFGTSYCQNNRVSYCLSAWHSVFLVLWLINFMFLKLEYSLLSLPSS